MASTNYLGRTVDLLFSTDWKELGTFSIMNMLSPEICTGPQKVAQTFALMLLTRRGSVKSDPEFGSSFLDNVNAGINNELQLSALFNLAVSDIKRYYRRIDQSGVPTDERFLSATLENIALTGDSLRLTVSVITEAGSGREVVVPIGVPIK